VKAPTLARRNRDVCVVGRKDARERDDEIMSLLELAAIARGDRRRAKSAVGREYLLKRAARLEERARQLEKAVSR
jgi:hypothetical protein